MRPILSRAALRSAAAAVTVLVAASYQAAADSTDTPPVPSLTWVDCENGFECATARVPLDYRRPLGRAISLAVIRHRVADPAQRAGTLLLQPGGPGNSGLAFATRTFPTLRPELRDRFDIVGFDVRGVGQSGQLRCWSDAEYSQAFAAAKGRPGADGFDFALRTATEFDAACQQRAGELLPYVGTGYVARDIDLLRQALGEERISFYGRSFGSYIGTVYASMFPRRVRAMVLDAGYDPVHYADRPYAYDRPQFQALDAAANRFFDWCAATPNLCPFGSGQPKVAFHQLLADLDTEPVAVPGKGVANGFTVVYRLVFNLNSGRARWPELGRALQQAQVRDTNSMLLAPQVTASFDFVTVNAVVECADRAYPSDVRQLRRNLAESVRLAPLLGAAVGYAPPFYDHNHAFACSRWPAERVSRHTGSYRAAGSPPILVVGVTGDPDTPYRDSVTLARTLDNGRLLTFRAEGHAGFNRSQCVTTAVTAYLADLTVPRRGAVCADEPAPGRPNRPLPPADPHVHP